MGWGRRGGRRRRQRRSVRDGHIKRGPGRSDLLDARQYIFVTDDIPRYHEVTRLGEVDDTPRREFRWAKIDTQGAALGKVSITGTSRPRNCDASEGAKATKISKRGTALAQYEDGRHVGARRLREAVKDPVSGLNSKGVEVGAEISSHEQDTSHSKPRAPHTFHKRILLRCVNGRGPMSNLLSREEIAKEVGHELSALISDDEVRHKFVG